MNGGTLWESVIVIIEILMNPIGHLAYFADFLGTS